MEMGWDEMRWPPALLAAAGVDWTPVLVLVGGVLRTAKARLLGCAK